MTNNRPLSKKLYWYNINLLNYFTEKYHNNIKYLEDNSVNFWKAVLPEGITADQLQPGPPEKFLVINDRKGKNDYVYHMHNNLPYIENKYHTDIANMSFTEICIETAKQYKTTGKIIDVFWSGGLDSTCMLLALLEVCPDQLHVILNPDKNEYMELFYNRVANLKHTFVYTLPELYGTAKADTNIFTTAVQADLLFGFFIDPNYLEKFQSYSLEQQLNIQSLNSRYNFSMFDVRFLSNTKLNTIDVNNHRPFFIQPLIEKFALNYILDSKMVFHSKGVRDPVTGSVSTNPTYTQAKMPLRNCIAELSGDKEYAYTVGKKPSIRYSVGGTHINEKLLEYNNLQKQLFNDTVLAITGEGTIIRGNNIQNFCLEHFQNEEWF